MDSMSDFVASAVEFIVGGILFTLSTAFLVVTIVSPGGWPELSKEHLALVSANATLVGIIFIATAYAAGVVGESLARSPVEFLLDRHSVRKPEFVVLPKPETVTEEKDRRGWSALRARMVAVTLGGDYTLAARNSARSERERQRAIVMTWHEQLHAEVQGQLKRLRLERVFTLSLLVTTVALGLRQDWRLFAMGAVASAWGVWLVNTRFQRFCGAIARAHQLVVNAGLKDPSNDAPAPSPLAAETVAVDAKPGVIFDLDGTLIDSEPAWARGFSYGLSQILVERGHGHHDLTPDQMARFQGGRVPDTVGAILGWLELDPELDDAETRQIVQAVIDWVTADFAANPVPIPEAVAAARALQQRGVPLAVASSSALPFIDAALESLGLSDAITIRMSAIDLPRGKPDPLVYLLTLHEMGLPASRVIAIEDSPVGVESAIRAGIQCVWFMPGQNVGERQRRLRALAATSTGEGTLAAEVDALVAPASSLTVEGVLEMLDARSGNLPPG